MALFQNSKVQRTPEEIRVRAERAKIEIANGRIAYTDKCGWVDFGHASGDGPLRLITSIMRQQPIRLSDSDWKLLLKYVSDHNLDLNRYTPIAYFQRMSSNGITVGTRSVYLVPKGLTKGEREGAAWAIFKEVSEQFERLQGTAPFNLGPNKGASSFGIGDLNGDKLAFYRLLRGYSQEEIQNMCEVRTPEDSQAKLDSQGGDPPNQDVWKKIPKLRSVPKIKSGLILPVLRDSTFFGSYP